MVVLFCGVSEKSGCLHALAGFLVGEGPVQGREVGGDSDAGGVPVCLTGRHSVPVAASGQP